PLLAVAAAQPAVALAVGISPLVVALLLAGAALVFTLAYRFVFASLYVLDDGLFVFNPLRSHMIKWNEVEAFETSCPDAFSLRNMLLSPSRDLGAAIKIAGSRRRVMVYALVSETTVSSKAKNATLVRLAELNEMAREAHERLGERRGNFGRRAQITAAAA
ncbi:MAG TPA: hypothetical protein VGO97_01920, partial [Solirubrobacterales bacterium]|nr:hypothetical protein [Solirubrobacterales bacterium]